MTAAPSPDEQAAVERFFVEWRNCDSDLVAKNTALILRELRAARAPLEAELASERESHRRQMMLSLQNYADNAAILGAETRRLEERIAHLETQREEAGREADLAASDARAEGARYLLRLTERDEARRKLDHVAAEWKEMRADLDDSKTGFRGVEVGPGGVWRWQGDGEDHPESLSCPVVMSATALREFVAARDEQNAAVARAREREREALLLEAQAIVDNAAEQALEGNDPGAAWGAERVLDAIRARGAPVSCVLPGSCNAKQPCLRDCFFRGLQEASEAVGAEPTRRPLPAGWGWSMYYHVGSLSHPDGRRIGEAVTNGRWIVWKDGVPTVPLSSGICGGDTEAERLTAAQHAVEDEAWARGLFGEVG